MIAVIFEVQPNDGKQEEYLALAADIRSELEKAEGFISVERFTSLTNEGKMLSLSFWRDEASIQAWRNQAKHRVAQAKGRGGIFSEYRIRVAEVSRDYSLFDRSEAPNDSKNIHD